MFFPIDNAVIVENFFGLQTLEIPILKKQVAGSMKQRGLIFIANHASHLDGLCIQNSLPFCLRKKLVIAAAQDHFWNPDKRMLHYALNSQLRAFPVKRTGNPRELFRTVGKILDRNDSVLIFPEGTRSRTGKLGEFFPSIGQLVKNVNAPVVPVFLYGTFDAWPANQRKPKRGKIQIRFHELVQFSPGSSAKDIRDALFALYQNEFAKDAGN